MFAVFAAVTKKADVECIDAVHSLGVLRSIIQRLYATESAKLQVAALKVVGDFSAGRSSTSNCSGGGGVDPIVAPS